MGNIIGSVGILAYVFIAAIAICYLFLPFSIFSRKDQIAALGKKLDSQTTELAAIRELLEQQSSKPK